MKRIFNILNMLKNNVVFATTHTCQEKGLERYLRAKIKQYAASPILVEHFTEELYRLKARKI